MITGRFFQSVALRLFATVLALLAVMGVARALEPVSIGRDTVAVDLMPAVELHRVGGNNFQVSTVPGADGIVRRIEVESVSANPSGNWAVFSLANNADTQIDRLVVAPHFKLAGSGVVWPDLGSRRIAAITPSSGFLRSLIPTMVFVREPPISTLKRGSALNCARLRAAATRGKASTSPDSSAATCAAGSSCCALPTGAAGR